MALPMVTSTNLLGLFHTVAAGTSSGACIYPRFLHVSILASRFGTPWLLCSMQALVISTRTRVLYPDLVAHRLTRDIEHDLRVSLFLSYLLFL